MLANGRHQLSPSMPRIRLERTVVLGDQASGSNLGVELSIVESRENIDETANRHHCLVSTERFLSA